MQYPNAKASIIFGNENDLINVPKPFVTIFKKDSAQDIKVDLGSYINGEKVFKTTSNNDYKLTPEDEEAIVEAPLLKRNYCQEEISKIDEILENVYEVQRVSFLIEDAER